MTDCDIGQKCKVFFLTQNQNMIVLMNICFVLLIPNVCEKCMYGVPKEPLKYKRRIKSIIKFYEKNIKYSNKTTGMITNKEQKVQKKQASKLEAYMVLLHRNKAYCTLKYFQKSQ